MNSFYHIHMAFGGYGYALQDNVRGWAGEGQPSLYTNMDLETVSVDG
jgi:hypothetical protein